MAYVYNGLVYAVAGGHQVGSLRGGNVHNVDGQLFGRLTPRGVVVHEDGSVSEAFLRLVADRDERRPALSPSLSQ